MGDNVFANSVRSLCTGLEKKFHVLIENKDHQNNISDMVKFVARGKSHVTSDA